MPLWWLFLLTGVAWTLVRLIVLRFDYTSRRLCRVLARRGELGEGERLAREAVALGAETDMLNAHGDALLDLAEVLALAGQDARAELDQALALYERKGNLVMAERTRSRLAEPTASR